MRTVFGLLALLLLASSPAAAEYADAMESYRKAWAAYATQRFDEAEDWARKSIRSDPQNPHSHALMGDLAYLKHDLPGAKSAWTKALALSPALLTLKDQIAQADLELEMEKHLNSFTIGQLQIRITNTLSPEQTLIILQTLTRAVQSLEPFFDYRPQRPVTILVYPKQFFYDSTHLPTEVLGLFDGKIRIAGLQGADVLGHEYGHVIVHDLTHGKAIRWVHEGLAQEAESIFAQNKMIVLNEASLPPLRRLMGIADRPGEDVVMQVRQFYPASHLLVKYLLEIRGWDRMRALLKALGQAKPTEQALQEVYGLDLETLEKRWRQWVRERAV